MLSFKSIGKSVFDRNRISRWWLWRPSCFSKWQQLQKQPSQDGVPYHPANFQINWLKRVWVRKWNFKMAAILFSQMAPTSKVTYPRWCPATVLIFKSIWKNHLWVRCQKQNFKMAAIFFFEVVPISKATCPGCPTTLLTFKSIGQSVFELESGNRISRLQPWRPSCFFSKWCQFWMQYSLFGALQPCLVSNRSDKVSLS